MSLLDLVQQQLGPNGTQDIASQIGADPGTTSTAIQAALPMLLGGMAGAARQPGGASAIAGMLGGGGAGGLGGMLGGLLGGGGGGLGGLLGGAGGGMGGGLGGMLGGLLGSHEGAVEQGVQQSSGLNSDQTKRLLLVLAPIVLAALANKRQQQQAQGAGADLDGDGIPDALEHEARQAGAQAPPHVGGLVGRMLDMARGQAS